MPIQKGPANLGTGAIDATELASGSVTPAKLSTGGPTWNTNGIFGIGLTPNTWYSTSKALQLGSTTSIEDLGGGTTIFNNAYRDVGGSSYYTTTAAASRYVFSGVQHSLQSAASGSANSAVAWTPVAAVELNKSLALQGATSQTGTGISFPASQSASSDANTLDDYEEGAWTPTFTFGSSAPSSVTYHTQSGRYTKIGRMVYIECYIRITAYSGGSGNVLVAGFPFTSASSPYGELFIGENAGFTVTGTYYGLSLEVNVGATSAILLKMAPNSASTAVAATEMGSATTVYLLFSGCYTTT